MRPAGALPLCYAPAENVAAQVFPVSGGRCGFVCPIGGFLTKRRLPMQNKKCLSAAWS